MNSKQCEVVMRMSDVMSVMWNCRCWLLLNKSASVACTGRNEENKIRQKCEPSAWTELESAVGKWETKNKSATKATIWIAITLTKPCHRVTPTPPLYLPLSIFTQMNHPFVHLLHIPLGHMIFILPFLAISSVCCFAVLSLQDEAHHLLLEIALKWVGRG